MQLPYNKEQPDGMQLVLMQASTKRNVMELIRDYPFASKDTDRRIVRVQLPEGTRQIVGRTILMEDWSSYALPDGVVFEL